MSKFRSYVCGIAVVTLAAAAWVGKTQLRAQLSGAIRPLTISYTESSYGLSKNGPPKHIVTETLGVRSDGSVAVARLRLNAGTSPSGQGQYTIRIADKSLHQYRVIDQFTQSKTTYPSEEMVEMRDIQPAVACAGAADQNVLGYSTVLVEKVTDFPNHSRYVRRAWYSPALDCLPLQVESTLQHSDGHGTFKVRTATVVALGAPPDWMFTVPANFVERKPSEVVQEAATRLQQPLTCPLPSASDQVYSDVQSRAATPKK